MIAGHIKGATHDFGKPRGWDNDKGHCGSLWLRLEPVEPGSQMINAMVVNVTEQGLQMTSAWYPTADELVRLVNGAPVYLTVVGTGHPPVALNVGLPADAQIIGVDPGGPNG